MNTSKIVYLVFTICISLISNVAIARVITINGTLQLQDSTPTINDIYVFQFGAPYYPTQSGVDWTLLGQTRSESNGDYTITLEVGDNTELALVVPYSYPRYSLIKKLAIGTQTIANNVLIKLPNNASQQLEYRARVLEDGNEIDYWKRVYKIVIVPLNLSDQGTWAQLSNATYSITKNRVFDVQDGEYRAFCLLALPGLGTGSSNTEVSFTLPLTSSLLDCNFP